MELQLLKPEHTRACALQQDKPPQWEACALQLEKSPHSQLEESPSSNQDWAKPKLNKEKKNFFNYLYKLKYFVFVLNKNLYYWNIWEKST